MFLAVTAFIPRVKDVRLFVERTLEARGALERREQLARVGLFARRVAVQLAKI
jgi:hypothetical protein